MSTVLITSTKISAIADNIRAIEGSSVELTLDQITSKLSYPSAATISVSNITGGKRLTFTPASNCSVKYNINGTPSTTSATATTVDITSVSSGTAQALSVSPLGLEGTTTSQAWSVSACEAPNITCIANTSVTITCNTLGASIYYTTDDSTPTTSSTLYTASFKPESSCTVRAIAIYSGYVNSSVSSDEYLTGFVGLKLTANTAGSTVTLGKTGSPSWTGYYSTDNGITWITYTPGTTGAITLSSVGSTVCFKGTLTAAQSTSNFLRFSMTGSIAASGNIMSMCSCDNYASVTTIPYEFCFCHLFNGCTSLTTAPSLPATTLTSYCYYYMFYGCTSLTTAPSLPATTAAHGCYWCMFSSCTSLTTAPSLPATTLADYCYECMFSSCTSLTAAPALPATTLANYCYDTMFSSCTSLTTVPALPATTLADYCCHWMFEGCTSLTTVPSTLPATTLASRCYNGMFDSCTSLTTAPSLPATTLATYCYRSMFTGCTSLTTAPALPATTLTDYCYGSMFFRCTSLTAAPALPATTLATYCYNQMFYNCSKLKINNDGSSGTLFFTCPSTIPSNAVSSMLINTGGSYTSDPVAGGTYYYY